VRLQGVPHLYGVDRSGRTTRLPFFGSADPTFAFPGDVQAPGVLRRGGTGAFVAEFAEVEIGTTNCPEQRHEFAVLRIELRAGETVSMPYPASMTTGCFGTVSLMGPLPGGR
jgi:hypothetical protein